MDLNIGRELTWARGLTRGKRKLSVTPLRCRDRRLVHRPYGADSLDGYRPQKQAYNSRPDAVVNNCCHVYARRAPSADAGDRPLSWRLARTTGGAEAGSAG